MHLHSTRPVVTCSTIIKWRDTEACGNGNDQLEDSKSKSPCDVRRKNAGTTPVPLKGATPLLHGGIARNQSSSCPQKSSWVQKVLHYRTVERSCRLGADTLMTHDARQSIIRRPLSPFFSRPFPPYFPPYKWIDASLRKRSVTAAKRSHVAVYSV